MRLTVAVGLLLGFLMAGPVLAGAEPINLTLEKAVDYALQHNLELEITRMELEKSRLELQQVESAFEPEVTLAISPLRWTGEGNLNDYKPNANIIGSITTRGGTTLALELSKDTLDSQGNDIDYGLTLSQQLLPWPAADSTVLGLERSQLSLGSQHLSLLEQVEALKLDVLDAYYSVLESQIQAQIAELDFKYAKEYLTIVQQKYKQGAAGQLDSLDAQAQYTSAEHSLLESKDAQDRTMSSLKDLIGMSPWQEINTEECSLEYPSSAISIAQAQQEALDNNTAIQQQQLAIQQQQLVLIGEKSKFSPSLDVSLGYTYSGPDSVSNNYEAALTLSIPLFNEKNRQTAIGIATQELKQAELTMQTLKRELATEIRGYVLDLQETQKELEYREKAQEQQCTALEITQEMFHAGAATTLEVLEREIACAKGRMEYLNTMKKYELQRAKLYKSMGRELDI